MRWTTFLLTVALLCLAVGGDSLGEPVIARNLDDNVRARLVAARLSETRGRYLIALCETNAKEPESIVVNFPAHSLTPHEQTLRAVIRSCVDWKKRDESGWSPARAKAIFSLPRGGPRPNGYSDLDECFLISLQLPSRD